MFAKNKKGASAATGKESADTAKAEEERLKAEAEQVARKKAEEEAEAARKKAAEEEQAKLAAGAAEAAEAEAARKKKAEEEAAEKNKAEEEAKKAEENKKKAEEDKKKAEEEAKRKAEEAERRAQEDAEKRDNQKKKATEDRSRQRWLGAPVPNGVDGATMAMGSVYDMKVAFAMIDKKNRGHLDRKQARNFCRCAGWILPDQQLDLLLDGTLGKVAKLLGHTGGTRAVDANKTFTFEELCDILEKNTAMSNGGVKDVTDALMRLASANSQIRRSKFQEVVLEAPDFTEGDIELILQMVGLQRSSDFDCSNLSSRLVNTVCAPPSIFEAQKQKETLSNPMSLYRSAVPKRGAAS